MRFSIGSTVVVSGYGVPFSLVASRFDSEVCRVTWLNEESDSPWVHVRRISERSDQAEYTVHACQLSPMPKESRHE